MEHSTLSTGGTVHLPTRYIVQRERGWLYYVPVSYPLVVVVEHLPVAECSPVAEYSLVAERLPVMEHLSVVEYPRVVAVKRYYWADCQGY